MVFQMCYNHFEYVVMPFGLTNEPVVFQRLMNDIFHEYLDDFVVCYIDDILIFLKNMEDHEKHACFVLKALDFMPSWKSVNSINLKWNS